MSSKVKVRMRRDSWRITAGQEVDVEKEIADQLLADGHADKTTGPSSSAAKKAAS